MKILNDIIISHRRARHRFLEISPGDDDDDDDEGDDVIGMAL